MRFTSWTVNTPHMEFCSQLDNSSGIWSQFHSCHFQGLSPTGIWMHSSLDWQSVLSRSCLHWFIIYLIPMWINFVLDWMHVKLWIISFSVSSLAVPISVRYWKIQKLTKTAYRRELVCSQTKYLCVAATYCWMFCSPLISDPSVISWGEGSDSDGTTQMIDGGLNVRRSQV